MSLTADNPWRLTPPTVSVDLARRIHHVRQAMTMIALDSYGHPELEGCLRAAGAAVDECARIATRDLDRARSAVPKHRPAPKSKRRRSRG